MANEAAAVAVMASAQRRVANRIEAWQEETTSEDFVTVLRTVRVWAVSDRCVAASVADTKLGSLWSYVASDALDVIDVDLPATAHIGRVSKTQWQIRW
jgi:hypothetical protein